LIDVVVKFPADPSTFLLLCLKQLTTHACEGLVRQFALGYVDARADIPGKITVYVESRHTLVENPPVLPVMLPEPVLHLESLAAIECLLVGLQARS
jgi:hypothetical protein